MNNDYFKEMYEKIKAYDALQELKKRNQFLRQELEREELIADNRRLEREIERLRKG
jgi:cell division protein FtsB